MISVEPEEVHDASQITCEGGGSQPTGIEQISHAESTIMSLQGNQGVQLTSQISLEEQERTSMTIPSEQSFLGVEIMQRFERPKQKVKEQHSNIPEYSMPSIPAPPLRHEHVYKRSDFLAESMLDKDRYRKYKSLSFVHAGLRSLESRPQENGSGWSQLFPNLKEFLKLQYQEVEGTVFIWLAVIPGVPNSPKILLHTLQLLTNIFIEKKKMRNIIITADAVEYNVLYCIRQDYGALFGHIYLYWGLWHALGNYLKQFFKSYRHAGVDLMFKKLHRSSQVESLLKVTPNWSYTNKMALSLAEALLHSQWSAFLNHSNNNLFDGEENVFDSEEQLKCKEVLHIWKEKSDEYTKASKESLITRVPEAQPQAPTIEMDGESESQSRLRSGKVLHKIDPAILKRIDPSVKSLQYSSGEEDTDKESTDISEPTSPLTSQSQNKPLESEIPVGQVNPTESKFHEEENEPEVSQVMSRSISPASSLTAQQSSPYTHPLPPSPGHEIFFSGTLSDSEDSLAQEMHSSPQIPEGEDIHVDVGPQYEEDQEMEGQNDPSLGEKQKELQDWFCHEILPLVEEFIKRAKKQDIVFKLFSNMIDDIMPYIIGFLAMRVDDFQAQMMVTKLMYEKVHVTQQSLYKHILLQVLEEFPRWEDFPKNCFEIAAGANEKSGSVGATLGRDEAHERVISLNLAYEHPIHPTLENIETMCQSTPVLCHNMRNMEQQFFKEMKKRKVVTPGEKSKEEKVIKTFLTCLTEFEAFRVKDRNRLFQPGTSSEIPQAVAENFLEKSDTSRNIAEAIVEQQVLKKNVYNKTALKKTVVHPFPNAEPKEKTKKKLKPDMEKKILTTLLHSQLKQHDKQSTETILGIGVAEKPQLFFNADGAPVTNTNKSTYMTTVLKMYGENNFQYVGNPAIESKATFIDGMPALFLAPILGLTSFGSYAQFLIKKKVIPHFANSQEVHIIFDVPFSWGFNLKQNVQQKRDALKKAVPPLQEEITDNTKVPSSSKWTSFLSNREDKRKLVYFVGEKLLLAKEWLKPGQSLIAGGCFPDNETYLITSNSAETLPALRSNHEEADTRMFAHAAWSSKTVIEFVSVDTDVFSILLLNHQKFDHKQIIIKSSENRGKLDMTKLMKEMNDDTNTELARIRKNGVSTPLFFGIIHPLIGSDILCSPRGFGPSWVIKSCLHYAAYLFHPETGLQHLGNAENNSKGAYIRFILSLFLKRFSSKIKRKPEEILRPMADYSEIISDLQKQTWVHTLETKTMIPSKDCLTLREKNFSFQLQVWTQATNPNIKVPDPLKYGWVQTENEFTLQADSAENMAKKKPIYDTIMRKCGCKSSQCLSGRCNCKKNGNHCTSLCECLNCENTEHSKSKTSEKAIPERVVIMEEEEICTSGSETEEAVDSDLDQGVDDDF